MKRLVSIYVDIPALRPGTVGAYALALLSAALALALRIALDPYVVGVQYITFFPAVIITTLISSCWPSLRHPQCCGDQFFRTVAPRVFLR
jgi:hypothetical protein